MRKRRKKRTVRKVDRLLGRNRDENGRSLTESFGWTYSIEHPSKAHVATRKSRLPRTRE